LQFGEVSKIEAMPLNLLLKNYHFAKLLLSDARILDTYD
jgi:hypothetical protein